MYRVGVKVYGAETFLTNELEFDSVDAAKKFGVDIFQRWAQVVEWEIRDNAGKLHHWSGESYV